MKTIIPLSLLLLAVFARTAKKPMPGSLKRTIADRQTNRNAIVNRLKRGPAPRSLSSPPVLCSSILTQFQLFDGTDFVSQGANTNAGQVWARKSGSGDNFQLVPTANGVGDYNNYLYDCTKSGYVYASDKDNNSPLSTDSSTITNPSQILCYLEGATVGGTLHCQEADGPNYSNFGVSSSQHSPDIYEIYKNKGNDITSVTLTTAAAGT